MNIILGGWLLIKAHLQIMACLCLIPLQQQYAFYLVITACETHPLETPLGTGTVSLSCPQSWTQAK